MAYHCRIFAVENKKTIDMETASKTQGKRKLDLLSAVENIVELAKDSQLSPEFYCKAAHFIKHLSDKLSLTKEQNVMMALFLDQSDDSRIGASDNCLFYCDDFYRNQQKKICHVAEIMYLCTVKNNWSDMT